jgi:hypothetical protein
MYTEKEIMVYFYNTNFKYGQNSYLLIHQLGPVDLEISQELVKLNLLKVNPSKSTFNSTWFDITPKGRALYNEYHGL